MCRALVLKLRDQAGAAWGVKPLGGAGKDLVVDGLGCLSGLDQEGGRYIRVSCSTRLSVKGRDENMSHPDWERTSQIDKTHMVEMAS